MNIPPDAKPKYIGREDMHARRKAKPPIDNACHSLPSGGKKRTSLFYFFPLSFLKFRSVRLSVCPCQNERIVQSDAFNIFKTGLHVIKMSNLDKSIERKRMWPLLDLRTGYPDRASNSVRPAAAADDERVIRRVFCGLSYFASRIRWREWISHFNEHSISMDLMRFIWRANEWNNQKTNIPRCISIE